MSTIRVVNLQHTDATVPNIVLESDGTSVFASGITISGTTTLTVSGTAEFASGTAAAPKLTFIDDNDTGIYSPAANNLGITTNGTAALTIDSSQRVGIGTTSVGRQLEVFGSTSSFIRLNHTGLSSNGLDVGYSSAGYAIINNTENTALAFQTNNTERMRIDSSGNVGIGTTSPSTTLHVKGSGDTDAASGAGSVRIQGGASAYSGYIGFDADKMSFGTDNSNRGLSLVAGGSERMRIDNAGEVGIGTTIPQSILHIDATSSTSYPSSFGGNTAYTPYGHELTLHNGSQGVTNSFASIYFDAGLNSSGARAGTARISAVRTGDYKADLVFGTRNTSFAERVRILATGGLTFNGDTATANALDDYEEGSWTPSLSDSGGGASWSFNGSGSVYTKVGRVVTVTTYMSSIGYSGTPSGYLRIGALPFTKGANSNFRGPVIVGRFNFGADTFLTAEFISSGSTDTLYLRASVNNDPGNDFSAANVNNGSGTLALTMTYFI